ncbi:MAG: hypothetical protein KG003_01755 [Bacteroidetes bacterium]|nr:hypothetical protein [Bacteroidota bacterium]
MKTMICNFCGSTAAFYVIHSTLVCGICKTGLPEDEPDDQDLFDDDFDLYSIRELSQILRGLAIQA